MTKRDSRGNVVVTGLLIVLLVAAVAFGVWVFQGRQDYKNNSDAKSSAAVNKALADQKKQLQAQFDDQAKLPNKTYKGSVTYGTISFDYPKTWSSYVDETSPTEPINAYFNPNQVPGAQSGAAFALRLELVSTPYSSVVQQYTQQTTGNKVTAVAYVPPKMKSVANVQPGVRLDGSIGQNSQGGAQNGSMVIIKVRDKTLMIYSLSNDFLGDFNNTVLPSLTFIP